MNSTPRFAQRDADGWGRVRGAAVRAGRGALLGAIALGLLGCGKAATSDTVAPVERQMRAGQAQPVERAPGSSASTVNFVTFALNALLVPLLDDDMPPRWADPSLSFDCEAGGVTVDDQPFDIGSPVPVGSFTVRWHMQRCTPFGDGTELTGDIELKVESRVDGYLAVVQPERLEVVSAGGREVLTEAFTARMGFGR